MSYAVIASATRLDPSQVSRICRGHFRTYSGAVVKICTFLGVTDAVAADGLAVVDSVQTDPAWSRLSRAVQKAWDQTPEGAAKLARVIAAVADISKR